MMTVSQHSALQADTEQQNTDTIIDNEFIPLGESELKLDMNSEGAYFIDKVELYCGVTPVESTENPSQAANESNTVSSRGVAEEIMKENDDGFDLEEGSTCTLREKIVEETEEIFDLDFASRCMLTSMLEHTEISQIRKQDWNHDQLKTWQTAADFCLQCYQKAMKSN
mmetsp:Transcript_15642/g.24329  ORF Transcript_15642/g.24329 Transcript_15642/m.24329 type:complete len:168 (+) Transcript_15642:73-576(+)